MICTGKQIFFNHEGKFFFYNDQDGNCVRVIINAGIGIQGPRGKQGVPGIPGPAGFIPFGNDTGVPDVYTTVLNAPPVNTDGFTFEVNIETGNDNTGASTLDIGLGALPILDSDLNPLAVGMIEGDSTYLFVYNSTGGGSYQLLGLAKPGPTELWIPGTGLESARLKNTATPNNAGGDYSVAEGSNTTAGGNNAHSEGIDTQANGFASHAEGSTTDAGGGASHAEGTRSSSPGISSHAEGDSTTASNLGAHAEGGNTLAIGVYSHAEGNGSIASFDNAHAEGSGTISSADGSHSEGSQSTASGSASHAEGQLTIASNSNSHAEGESTIASGANSHSEGNSTRAANANAHSQNQSTLASGTNSHAGGLRAEALAIQSFNHSTASIVGSSQASGNDSAILGGVDNNIDAASPRSVALGGTANDIIAEPDTAQAQELRVTTNVKITQGANKPVGTAALNGAAAFTDVANTLVKTGAIVLLTYETIGGVNTTISAPIASIVNGVSFRVVHSVGDTSTVNYLIINP